MDADSCAHREERRKARLSVALPSVGLFDLKVAEVRAHLTHDEGILSEAWLSDDDFT